MIPVESTGASDLGLSDEVRDFAVVKDERY